MLFVETEMPKVLLDAIYQATKRYKAKYYPEGIQNLAGSMTHHMVAVLSLVDEIDRLYQT